MFFLYKYLSPFLSQTRNVVVLSYPKSGRTWLRVMLSDLGLNPGFDHVMTKFSYFKKPGDITKGLEGLKDNRILFLYRDPRDVVVSAYYYYKYNKAYHDLDFKVFLRKPEMGFEKIVAFNSYVLNNPQIFMNFMSVSYEELHANPVKELQKCLKFMAVKHICEDDIAKVVKKHSFSNMQKNEKNKNLRKIYGASLFPAPRNDNGEKSLKIRQGKVHGYKELMDEEDCKFCDEILSKYLSYV